MQKIGRPSLFKNIVEFYLTREFGKVDWKDLEYCLAAVKKYGIALAYIKKQTPDICLAAVKQDGWALQYVKEQTPEICLEAVKNEEHALKFVSEEVYNEHIFLG